MGAFSITEVNFLRLLKACEMGLLKHDSSESMSRTTAARYKQYVRTLTSYAEELQRIAEADSEEPEDVSSGHVSRQMSHCSLSPDEMVQHQQKVLLIQEALQRVVLSLDTCADPGTVSNMQARTDKSALTTVSRRSVVRYSSQPSPRAESSDSASGRTRHRRPAAAARGNEKRTGKVTAQLGAADEVDAQDELQDQLAGDLLDMTRRFKQQQLALRSQAEEDRQVLSNTDKLVSSNGEQLRTRVSALQKLEGAIGGWQTCKIICGLMVCVGIFTFTFLFMRLVGKRG